MTKFDLLPAELQIEIFSYLQASDIKAARGVSTKFRDNATPVLFRSILACARYQAMGAFQKISLHSIYPTYVKEIVFDGSVFEADLAQHEHAYENVWSMDRFRVLQTNYWGRRGRWKKYQAMFQEQEDIKASGVLLQTMARALEWMENISSIVYSPHQHLVPAEVKDMRDIFPQSPASSTSLSHRAHAYTSSNHAFRHLIGAIYMSKYRGIRELRVEPYQEGTPGTEFSLAMFSFPEPDDFHAGQYLFQNLTQLELNITSRRLPDIAGSSTAEQLANLAELINTAADLRYLALHISHRKRQGEVMYSDLFPDGQPVFPYLGLLATWPKLRSVSLKGITAGEKDMTELVTRHKDTLRSLVVKKCSLKSGFWAEVVDEVIFNSMITLFILDQVNERPVLGASWLTDDHQDERWSYEGHLIVSDDDRAFVDTNTDKKSVYDLRREI